MFNSLQQGGLFISFIWLKIIFSYLFISTTITTLICAYLQEINASVITIGLIFGGLYGLYQAEKIRGKYGLIKYHQQVKKIQQYFE